MEPRQHSTAIASDCRSSHASCRYHRQRAPGPELLASERTSSVITIDLRKNKTKLLSFQIAPRSIELEPPNVDHSPFAPIALETLADNIGAKMTALVGRGAPRDFLDIARVAAEHLATPTDLWALYKAKNPTSSLMLAKAQVSQNLAAIELRRPLDTLTATDREHASASGLGSRPNSSTPAANLLDRSSQSSTVMNAIEQTSRGVKAGITMDLDDRVYPDLDRAPTELVNDADRSDYVMRVCGAWEFFRPTLQTLELFSQWRNVFDAFPIPASPAYHAFRTIYGWPPSRAQQTAHYAFDDDLSVV